MIFLSWSFQVENLLANYYRSDILANKSFKTKIYNRLYFIICLFKHSHIQHLIIHIQHLVIIESLIFLHKTKFITMGKSKIFLKIFYFGDCFNFGWRMALGILNYEVVDFLVFFKFEPLLSNKFINF